MPDRFDQLSPRDVAITLRSLRRRLNSVLKATDDADLMGLAERAGPDGSSLASLANDFARGTGLRTSALTQALDHEHPVVAAAVLDADDRVFVDDRPLGVAASLLSALDDAESVAERVERATAAELSRAVDVAGGTTTSALVIARQLARESIDALSASERQLVWMRSVV